MKKPPPPHHNQNRIKNRIPAEPSGPQRGHEPQTSLLLRETFPAPPPSAKGRVIGIDCHPDTFTWAVLTGTSLHDARLLECHDGLPLERLLDWAGQQGTPEDTFLMEAGSNSFEICRRLQAMGRRAWVLESAHVGRHARLHCDNDKTAAVRIAKVYLIGHAPCVWLPDPVTADRRVLLHAHQSAVTSCTAAGNALKGYLNQYTVRPGKRSMDTAAFAAWVHRQRDWTALQQAVLNDHLQQVKACRERRASLHRLIAAEIAAAPLMLRSLKILGIGPVSAFALLAVTGDVRRFARPEQLASYLGLSPGQRQSGHGKDIRLGVRRNGRSDIRHLLIQGAHAILRSARDSALGRWGWKLFARKGQRNIAVTAVARKMAVQVWHLLMGHGPAAGAPENSFREKLRKLTVTLGKPLRARLALPATLEACVHYFLQQQQLPAVPGPGPAPQPELFQALPQEKA